MTRVLMTLDAVGGVWRYAMDLARALSAHNHSVNFAGLGPRPSAAQRAEALTIGRLEWGEQPLDWMAETPGDLAGIAPWIERLARAGSADVIHLNVPSQAADLPRGAPVVAVSHSCLGTWFRAVEHRPVPRHLAWQQRLTEKGLRRADAVIAPSHAHAALTEEVHGVTGIQVIPNASSVAAHPPSDGDGSVIAAGRWWDPGKNGKLLDQAALLSGARVTMIGACEGTDGQSFTPVSADAIGPLSHAETLDRLAAASIFVSPSLYEPFGLAALEAARKGRPLILADIPVYRELWEGAALFCPPHDAYSLALMIHDLLQSRSLRLRLGKAARQRAIAFGSGAQGTRMRDLYQGLLVSENAG